MSQVAIIDVASSNPQIPTKINCDEDFAIPIANELDVFGNTVINGKNSKALYTIGAGKVVTADIQVTTALSSAPADAAKAGLASFDDSHFTVNSSTGYVSLKGGDQAIDSITVDQNTDPGVNPVLPDSNGNITVSGDVVAAHSVPIETHSRGLNAYNIEVQYSTAVAATDGTKAGVASFDSATFAVDASGFVELTTTGLAETITGDSGGALSPTANNWNIFGLSGSKTSGSGSTLTVKSPPYTDSTAATLTINSGTFATAAGAYTLPAAPADGDLCEIICITTGIVVTANTGQEIQIAGDVTSTAGTATNSAKGDSLCLRYRATDTAWYASSSPNGVWVLA